MQKNKKLTPEQYNVCFLKGTEQPFSGKYDDFYDNGIYCCANCDNPLFISESKFKSGSGWPAFDRPVKEENVKYIDDNSLGMERVEIVCAKCDAHLGHIFNDGPTATGKRYCANSLSMEFRLK